MPRKRKPKLCTKKNEKRKKLAHRTLPVSVPLNSVTVLKVSIPLCAVKGSDTIAKATASNLEILRVRLASLGLLPPNWAVVSPETSEDAMLVMVKLATSSLPSVSTPFSVAIRETFTWTLTVADHPLERGDSEALAGIPPVIDSPYGVVNLLKTLDASKICTGNPDDKFVELIDARKGVIKDVSGMYL